MGFGPSMVEASELPEGPCSDAITDHVRTKTDTSSTDGGESVVVAIGRSAIPSHGGIDGEDRC